MGAMDIEHINADLDAIDEGSSSPSVKACARMLWTVRDFLAPDRHGRFKSGPCAIFFAS